MRVFTVYVKTIEKTIHINFSSKVIPDNTENSRAQINNQLVACATKFLVLCLKNHAWSLHCNFRAKVQCDFASAYSGDHTNIL